MNLYSIVINGTTFSHFVVLATSKDSAEKLAWIKSGADRLKKGDALMTSSSRLNDGHYIVGAVFLNSGE